MSPVKTEKKNRTKKKELQSSPEYCELPYSKHVARCAVIHAWLIDRLDGVVT